MFNRLWKFLFPIRAISHVSYDVTVNERRPHASIGCKHQNGFHGGKHAANAANKNSRIFIIQIFMLLNLLHPFHKGVIEVSNDVVQTHKIEFMYQPKLEQCVKTIGKISVE